MKIGVQLFPGRPASLVDEARRCEALGFDSVWVADHYTGGGRDASWVVPEIFSVLGAMAAATERIELGSCVVSLAKRSAAATAHAALTLSELSGGRFALGIGTGFGPDMQPFGVDGSRPAARCAEGLEIIHGLFAATEERPYSIDGRWETLAGAYLNLPEAERPPVLVAAQAPRMMRLTEQHADGWLPFALTPELYGEFLARMPERRAGFRAGLWLPAFLETDGEDRTAEAEATGRLYLSMAPEVLRSALGDAAGGQAAGTATWTPEQAVAAQKAIPRELARAATLHGRPADCVATLRAFAAAGCDCVVLRITDPRRRSREVEAFARTVLPELRDLAAVTGHTTLRPHAAGA